MEAQNVEEGVCGFNISKENCYRQGYTVLTLFQL